MADFEPSISSLNDWIAAGQNVRIFAGEETLAARGW